MNISPGGSCETFYLQFENSTTLHEQNVLLYVHKRVFSQVDKIKFLFPGKMNDH